MATSSLFRAVEISTDEDRERFLQALIASEKQGAVQTPECTARAMSAEEIKRFLGTDRVIHDAPVAHRISEMKK